MNEIECTKCIYNINNECKIGGWTIPKVGCQDGKAKPMTNADRIRSMDDEELADIITNDWCEVACHSPIWCDGNCEAMVLDWLHKESGEE